MTDQEIEKFCDNGDGTYSPIRLIQCLWKELTGKECSEEQAQSIMTMGMRMAQERLTAMQAAVEK